MKKKNSKTQVSTRQAETNYQSKNIVGTLDVSKSGNAFVIVKGWDKDILIPKEQTNGALHKDIVSVEIIKHGEKRKIGRIKNVVKRKTNSWIGNIQLMGNKYVFIANTKYKIFDAMEIQNIDTFGDIDLQQKVIATFISNKNRQLSVVVEKIANAQNTDAFMLNEILGEHGFVTTFSDETISLAQNFQIDFNQEVKRRKDFRDVLTFTIDPNDAKDFDDALSIQYLKDGVMEIGIHIADVSHFVESGSTLDKEAYERATSVYMPGFVSPMLPNNLSDNLCSLLPHTDRLTFSVIVQASIQNNEVVFHHINYAKTIIHSNRRFAYEEVQKIIESQDGEYKKEILDLYKISKILRQQRIDSGSFNFSSTEIKFVLDEFNFPTGVILKESKESHQMVEEFMLLANKKVAEFVFKKNPKIPLPYRVHDVPDTKKMDLFVELIKKNGYAFLPQHKKKFAAFVNNLLIESKSSPKHYLFEKLSIRSMAKAIYTIKNIGHYGLNFEYYTHFTSPIRRYPDIITHRLLQHILEEKSDHIENKKIESMCVHCSEQERNAVDAERSSIKYKQTQLMSRYVGSTFDAIVTGVSSHCMWAETLLHKCEGVIKMEDLLLIDDFLYKHEDFCLVGKKTNKVFEMGTPIKILVASAFVEDKELNYTLII